MNITLKTNQYIGKKSYRSGSEVEVPDDRARRIIALGHAEKTTNVVVNATLNDEPIEVEVAMREPKTEKAVRKTRLKKRKRELGE